jgi:catechol 2,3-dioxygenase-like lactoylglutathione lyase family enzyme
MATATDTTKTDQDTRSGRHPFVQGVHGVRYQVKDVARSVAFYTTHLGFTLEHQQLPAFANVSLGDAQILLSGPQARDLDRCRTDSNRSPAAGIESCFGLTIFQRSSRS